MFRCKQKIQYSASSNCSLPSTVFSDDGSCSDRFVSGHDPLPDCENFRLKNLLKAGIPLEQVNTKVIDSGYVDLSNLSKPAETKSAETKSAETKSAETKSAEINSAETSIQTN